MSEQQFWDWIEAQLPNVLGYPVFSIGQEVLFKRFNQIVLAEVESYIVGRDSNGDLNIQYVLWVDGCIWLDTQNHKDLLKLNPIANNLPSSNKTHNSQCLTN